MNMTVLVLAAVSMIGAVAVAQPAPSRPTRPAGTGDCHGACSRRSVVAGYGRRFGQQQSNGGDY